MHEEKFRIELGGGTCPRDGFLNIADRDDGARIDLHIDLEHIGSTYTYGIRPASKFWEPLPFRDETVCEVYSAHCLEHVRNLMGVLSELARVCCNGAKITIRVPHWNSPDARCPAHKHVIGEETVKGWCNRGFAVPGGVKMFDLVAVEHVPGPLFDEAQQLHPGWKDSQILKFVPGAAFETRFELKVRRSA